MDSCCLNLKPNSHFAKAKGGLNRENDWFWGDRIRGSLKNDVWVNQLAKSLRTEKKARKFRPGVSFAVITSNNAPEAVVSSFHSVIYLKSKTAITSLKYIKML